MKKVAQVNRNPETPKPRNPKPKRALVLYSGGLDSRLVVRILQDQGYEITALYFNLPFGCGCCNLSCNFHFAQSSQVKMIIKDVTKGELLKEYLSILKKPKHGIGSGINPCKDCKIFMFKKAKEYADEYGIKIIATGEVPGQRPMSQTESAQKIIDAECGFKITRPLADLGIHGRSRKIQMELAEKYKIKYPSPGGGCFLCEKIHSKKLKHLLQKNLITEETLPLTMIGRHFAIDDTWLVVARNEKESETISKFKNHIPGKKGTPSIYFSKESRKTLELQRAYSTGDNEELRAKFNKYKL
ncbi:MAG: 7-cyano-7-deazaguanine synthase [Nanoarchaeota archaeon]|nr:7-cyano-7-deazaguanine synthase [Nanoarchaeota archaeon]